MAPVGQAWKERLPWEATLPTCQLGARNEGPGAPSARSRPTGRGQQHPPRSAALLGPSEAGAHSASAKAGQVRSGPDRTEKRLAAVPMVQREGTPPGRKCDPRNRRKVPTELTPQESVRANADIPGEMEQGTGSGVFSWGSTRCEIRGWASVGAGALSVSGCPREGLRDCHRRGGRRDQRTGGAGAAGLENERCGLGATDPRGEPPLLAGCSPPSAPASRTALGVAVDAHLRRAAPPGGGESVGSCPTGRDRRDTPALGETGVSVKTCPCCEAVLLDGKVLPIDGPDRKLVPVGVSYRKPRPPRSQLWALSEPQRLRPQDPTRRAGEDVSQRGQRRSGEGGVSAEKRGDSGADVGAGDSLWG